jgi:hypothetical protein
VGLPRIEREFTTAQLANNNIAFKIQAHFSTKNNNRNLQASKAELGNSYILILGNFHTKMAIFFLLASNNAIIETERSTRLKAYRLFAIYKILYRE